MTPIPGFPNCLDDQAAAWFSEAQTRLAEEPTKALPVILPQLPRRLGRQPFVAGIHEVAGIQLDLAVWRRCDAGALTLLETANTPQTQLLDLYYHGDLEEKTMLFRSMACMPISDVTITLLGEAQRTNTGDHFEAAVCDSNLLVRATQDGAFSQQEFNRTVLKVAFTDLAFPRLLGAATLANEELSRMLQDLATEREAAGRRVWRDTNRLIAHAPTLGSLARLAGGLEHGDDAQRLAAAEGVALVQDQALQAMARERIEREPVAAIRDALIAATQ
jgi:hypothetical protein